MYRFPITKKGLDSLKAEIKKLKTHDRQDVIKDIAVARAFGDLSENAEYKAAKEKQSFIEGKISDLEKKLANAEVIDVSSLSNESIKFGATVKLFENDTENEVTYSIVSTYEANLEKCKISVSSPIARALIGKSVGDLIDVKTPKGYKSYEVIEISYCE
ncbi:transcription elongation factor GreA [Rickettsia endosymbiont of Cardiosporidium cionae]|uniref:transcription elongation factor GreA n=1 Tax=Rickettsia endosymbiont of Cardiosporidium cionae TaxID=2777155 RepID=UPI001895D331|nr:transcription elongation factor GreA [Rickettsia endosymbiont of Cardiosporidium cionae]KAF8818106.1 transcription elongation factor GreA [Rickettsia endosymbiont of Cardiosporidium cionae]